MIKTLRKAVDKSLKTGNPQVQSVSKDLLKNQIDTDESLNIQNVGVFRNSDVVSLLEKDEKKLVFEKVQVTKNKAILNTKINKSNLFNNKKISDIFNKKFSAYEELVGISQERPEIISMVNFLPITNGNLELSDISDFQSSNILTKEGKYFLSQILANEIQASDIKFFFEKLEKVFPKVKNLLKSTTLNFSSNISNVEEIANFLFNIVEYVESLRENLDLRNTIYQISDQNKNDVSTSINKNNINTSKGLLSNTTALQSILRPNIFSLLENFGFNKSNVANFSSTKLWIQTLHELKSCLLNYSDNFNEEKSAKKLSDKNAFNTLIEEKKYFSISADINPIEFFAGVEADPLVDLSVSFVTNAWKNIYRNLKHSDSEFVICNLLNYCSKELKYSNALSDKTSISALTAEGYQLSSINDDIFSFIVGDTSFSLDKIQQSDVNNTLTNLAFSIPEPTIATLTFETRYIENQKAVYTPGYEYFVNSIYDVKNAELNLEKFNLLLDKLNKSTSRARNLLSSLEVIEESNNVDILAAQSRSTVYNIDSFFSYFVSNICDNAGKTNAKILADDVAAIYTLAKKDQELKSLLFLSTLFRSILEAESETFALKFIKKELTLSPNSLNRIIDLIVQRVVKISNATDSANKQYTKMTIADLKQSLKKGTYTTKIVDDFLKFYYTNFNEDAFVDGKTKFRQVQDTAILMSLFDVCVNCISEFSNKSIKSVVVSPTQAKQLIEFVFETKNKNNLDKIKSIKTRLTNEVNIQKNSVSFVFETLTKLQQNFNLTKTLITSAEAKETFKKINNALNNGMLFKSLMNEQQLHLIISNLKDVVEISKTKKDINSEEAFDIIDESIVDAKLKNALLTTFSDIKFNEANGFNKKIVSVGVPCGFTKNLNLKSKDGFNTFSKEKTEKDIITINVHKVDLQNPDLVYSPIKFLFELSRFPVRNSNYYSEVSSNASLVDICSSIPTRDFSQSLATDSGVYYYNKDNSVNSKTKKPAFANSSYSFLSSKQKEEIAVNHVLSFLYEVYIKIMTNVNISDYSFALDPQKILKINPDVLKDISGNYLDLIKNHTQKTSVNKSSLKLFSGITNTIQNNNSLSGFKKDANLLSQNNTSVQKNLTQKTADTYLHGLKILDSVSKLTTTLMNDFALIKTLISPKKFDRVFHVMVDPDDFDINYNETIKTAQGKMALEQLIARGDVVQMSNNKSFKYKDRTKTQDDIVLEKYFVSIETFGGEVV